MQQGEEPGSRPEGGGDGAGALAVEHWRRVKALFLEALEHPALEQTAFVARACGDDARLREEVISLLESERAAGGFAERPAVELLGEDGLAGPPGGHRLERGARLGAYEVTGFLSAGGMGEVYRARDTVLGRPVAIKTLTAGPADGPAKRRLVREAKHAATLDHPNICTIYDVGDAAGTPFIVMAFVDGRPLSEVLQTAPLRLDDALAYGIQIADALEHAHAHGIVHRDLKSSNVVVDRAGRAIVLDFGLSKRVLDAPGDAPESSVTGQGALAGTPTHMAPERLRGAPADVRSDVWSLGVLLYELATGGLPFHGRTPFETTSAILHDAAQPIGSRVPLALRLVIERCLVKDPDARYQRAAEVRDALDAIRRRRAWPLVGRLLVSGRRRTLYAAAAVAAAGGLLAMGFGQVREWFAGIAGGGVSTVALLPLENATGDPETEYYASGLTEALIGQLATLGNVRVIAGASAAHAARTTSSPAAAAQQLGADVILEGRLRQASDRVAVDLRLIRPSRGRVLWSDTYERSASQVLALQADVVHGLAAAVRLTLRSGARERLATARAVNPEAYQAYLKGRYEWNQRTQASLELAIAHFERAIELDPTYAPAHAALADCFNQLGTLMVGTGSPREFRPRAAAAAIRALQIDPYSAEAYAALGYVRHYDFAFAEAEQAFRRAIELNPSYPLARIWYANLLMSRGRLDEAREQVYAARDLDPFSLIINTNVGWVLNVARRYDEAITHLQETLQLDSTYAHARWRLGTALMGAGRYSEAYEEAQRVVALTGRAAPALGLLAAASAGLGRPDEVRAILDELHERTRRGYVPPGTMVDVYTLRGDVEQALIWVSRAIEERANYVVYMPLDTGAGPLQRDPRFQALVAAAGLK